MYRALRHAARRTRILRTYRHTQQGRLWVRPPPASCAETVACLAMLSATVLDLTMSVVHPPLPWFLVCVSLHASTLAYFVWHYVLPDLPCDEEERP
jgi:hypothetical protein